MLGRGRIAPLSILKDMEGAVQRGTEWEALMGASEWVEPGQKIPAVVILENMPERWTQPMEPDAGLL